MREDYERQQALDDLAEVLALSPDEAEEVVEEVIEAYVVAEEYAKPTGEGLLRRQARQLLIDEMNKIKQTKNAKALADYRAAVDAYNIAVRTGEEPGAFPTEPVYTPVFSDKAINAAVQMARHQTGWHELLQHCGF